MPPHSHDSRETLPWSSLPLSLSLSWNTNIIHSSVRSPPSSFSSSSSLWYFLLNRLPCFTRCRTRGEKERTRTQTQKVSLGALVAHRQVRPLWYDRYYISCVCVCVSISLCWNDEKSNNRQSLDPNFGGEKHKNTRKGAEGTRKTTITNLKHSAGPTCREKRLSLLRLWLVAGRAALGCCSPDDQDWWPDSVYVYTQHFNV